MSKINAHFVWAGSSKNGMAGNNKNKFTVIDFLQVKMEVASNFIMVIKLLLMYCHFYSVRPAFNDIWLKVAGVCVLHALNRETETQFGHFYSYQMIRALALCFYSPIPVGIKIIFYGPELTILNHYLCLAEN